MSQTYDRNGVRVYGGQDAKLLRRRDDTLVAVSPLTGMPIGRVIPVDEPEPEAAASEITEPSSTLTLALAACVGALLILVLAYAAWHAGRAYERDIGTSRFSYR